MATNSSGIMGWVRAVDNPGFPLHTYQDDGTAHCEVCGLILYKAVHAETFESERLTYQEGIGE